MATSDKNREFEQIVAGLTADFPSLAPRRPWARWVVATVAVAGGLAWGLLSVAMVAWRAIGVAMTCAVVVLAAAVAAVDFYRRRR